MGEKIRLFFLGTSDSIPTASRNHSAFLIFYKGENILIDCGEGTQRQIRKARLNPCKLTKILITHWHADHTLGLAGILKTLALSGYNKTLFIYGPPGIKTQLGLLLKLFGFNNEYEIRVEEVEGRFFENEDFYLEAASMVHKVPCNSYSFCVREKIRINKSKLKKFKIPPGPHLKKLKEGKDFFYNNKKYLSKDFIYKENLRKVSFVLDTSFNERIVPFVKNSDVLVCESTYRSDMEDKAIEYNHLTSEQAAKIAKNGKIKRLFLVHISQRFSKDTEKVLKEARKIFKNTFLPKDLDVIEV
ncbi:MAG: ribonuclease Z [Candidatus Pacearchaeota archaeon]